MKKPYPSPFSARRFVACVLCSLGLCLALLGADSLISTTSQARAATQATTSQLQVGVSYHNDISPPLRELAQLSYDVRQEREGPENPKLPNFHQDRPDPVIQGSILGQLAPNIPAPILNFDGIPYPGVGCNCAPPDPNGEVGATQYVQMVNEGYQVFSKSTGA